MPLILVTVFCESRYFYLVLLSNGLSLQWLEVGLRFLARDRSGLVGEGTEP